MFTKKSSLYPTLSDVIIIKLGVDYFAFNQVATTYGYKYIIVATLRLQLIKTHGSESHGQVK